MIVHNKEAIAKYNLTRKTYGGLVILLQGVLKYAKKKGYTDYSIGTFFADFVPPKAIFARKTPPSDAEEVFYDDEVALLLAYFRKKGDLRHLGLILLFQTGMRIGELSALKPSDVSVADKAITIRRTETAYDRDGHRVVGVQDEPKTEGGYRRVLLPDAALVTLKEIQRINPFGEWLFCRPDGSRIRSKAFRDALKTACVKVGIPVRTPHKARKTYASTLLEAGLDEKAVQKQMGHKDIMTTKRVYDFSTKRESARQKEISKIISF